jgi:L-ascorbate metabolism protein UlaG (beta-lactamase superfamily)
VIRPVLKDDTFLADVRAANHNHTDHLDGETLGPLLLAT